METESVPHENIATYRILYLVEVGLREFIIEEMETNFGSRWWSSRLRNEQNKLPFTEKVQYERRQKWMHVISYHPLYYTNLTTLREIIRQKDNWREVFAPYFENPAAIESPLSDLEPIRNKIAHNRRVTAPDLRVAENTLNKLENFIGISRFSQLCNRNTHADHLSDTIQLLRAEIQSQVRNCLSLRPVSDLEVSSRCQAAWWFDSEYLETDISAIESLLLILAEYRLIPRTRGAQHEIEKWVEKRDINAKLALADDAFKTLSLALRG